MPSIISASFYVGIFISLSSQFLFLHALNRKADKRAGLFFYQHVH